MLIKVPIGKWLGLFTHEFDCETAFFDGGQLLGCSIFDHGCDGVLFNLVECEFYQLRGFESKG